MPKFKGGDRVIAGEPRQGAAVGDVVEYDRVSDTYLVRFQDLGGFDLRFSEDELTKVKTPPTLQVGDRVASTVCLSRGKVVQIRKKRRGTYKAGTLTYLVRCRDDQVKGNFIDMWFDEDELIKVKPKRKSRIKKRSAWDVLMEESV